MAADEGRYYEVQINCVTVTPRDIALKLKMLPGQCHALEYVWRAGRKPGASMVSDLRKAINHLEWLIKKIEKGALDEQEEKRFIPVIE